MAVTDVNVIDGIAFDDDNKTLIMEIYDHLHFEGKFEFDHIVILQDKLNTYLWYIESKQYADIYPDKQFDNFVINIHFRYEITENCKKYINDMDEVYPGIKKFKDREETNQMTVGNALFMDMWELCNSD